MELCVAPRARLIVEPGATPKAFGLKRESHVGLNRAFSAGFCHMFVPGTLPRLELSRAFGAERHADCASHSEAATVVV